MKTSAKTADFDALSLVKATVNTCAHLGLSQGTLAQIIGVSPATISRFADGQNASAMAGKTREHTLLFMRAYRSLNAILGNQTYEREWLTTPNSGLNGVPLELMKSTEGLVHVVNYLDSHRIGV